MKSGRLQTLLGGGLLLCLFLFGATRVWWKTAAEREGVIIRFAHWRLEEPTVMALDEIAREYEHLHPGVRIEQLAIPLRAWRAWLQTQLVGGTAPDLIVSAFGVDEVTLGRYFVPLDDAVAEPNPYNSGTPLAGRPWRDTFVDGMAAPNYNENLLAVYSAPISGNTFRLFYNLDLLRELTGSAVPPDDLAELLEVASAAKKWRERYGRTLTVMAGAYDRSLPLFDRLFQWRMQPLNPILDRDRNLSVSFAEMGTGYLQGRWSFEQGPAREVLDLLGTVGQMSQPGFLGQRQDDALFLFLQGRAVAAVGASWDAANIARLAGFPVGLADLPFPSPSDGRFGGEGVARPSEAATALNFSFGLTRASKHPAQAIDFLRYLTSQGANQSFSEKSNNIPAVVGVRPIGTTKSFMPVLTGAVPGPTVVYGTSVRGATNHIYETSLHELTNPGGTPEAFLARFEPPYRRALQADLSRDLRFAIRYANRVESVLAVALRSGDEADKNRWRVFSEAQTLRETAAAQIAYVLADVE